MCHLCDVDSMTASYGATAATPRHASPSAAGRSRLFLVVSLVGAAFVVALARRNPSVADASLAARAAAATPTPSAGDASYTVELDLRSSAALRAFLERDANLSTADLPASVRLTVWPARVMGDALGAQALGGHVAFSLQYKRDRAPSSLSLLVVASLAGDVEAVWPSRGVSADALKPFDADRLLLALNVDASEKGPTALWPWRDAERGAAPVEIAAGRRANSHDVQVASAPAGGGLAFWQPAEGLALRLVDGATGEVLRVVNASAPPNLAGTDGFNHVTVVGGGAAAYLNGRYTNSIVKLDLDAARGRGRELWRCGGLNGSFALVDEAGVRYEPRTAAYRALNHGAASLWAGAHNGEYFGEGEYFLMDNAYSHLDRASPAFVAEDSAVRVLRLDEAARVAYANWSYAIPKQIVYGDADRLPGGNVLSCNWPWVVGARGGGWDDYEWRAFEVVRASKQLAWKLEVFGNASAGQTRNQSSVGWMAYSVERWYDAPLVYGVACARARLAFTAHDAFKSHEPQPGAASVARAGAGAGAGGARVVNATPIAFAAHWRAAELAIEDAALEAGGEYELTVTNRFGQSARVNFSCDAG